MLLNNFRTGFRTAHWPASWFFSFRSRYFSSYLYYCSVICLPVLATCTNL